MGNFNLIVNLSSILPCRLIKLLPTVFLIADEITRDHQKRIRKSAYDEHLCMRMSKKSLKLTITIVSGLA